MMFEREGIYPIICYIGNSNCPHPPAPLYAKGNSDTFQKYQKRKVEYEAAMRKRDRWYGESYSLTQYIKTDLSKCGYWSKSKREALSFFFHADDFAELFIKDIFGTAEKAYWMTESKDEIAYAYTQWFEKKRMELRRKMTELQAIRSSASVAQISGKNITHGGIANLLKVLTKTMEKQGANIKSIAKMQYAVCTQAGILIPDEFIEDVAVIVDCQVTSHEESKKEFAG